MIYSLIRRITGLDSADRLEDDLDVNLDSISEPCSPNIANLVQQLLLLTVDADEFVAQILQNNKQTYPGFDYANNFVNGYNLIQYAAATGAVHVVDYFIRQFGSTFFDCGTCSAPLHVACLEGHVGVVKLLLKAGVSPVKRVSVCYPESHRCLSAGLSTTCWLGNLTSWLGVSAAFNYSDAEQFTPAQLAVQTDAAHVLSLLFGYQTDADIMMTRQQLFSEACRFGSLKCVNVLLDLRLCVDMPPIKMNELDEHGYSPFHYAITSSYELSQLLIRNGADINQLSADNETVLHILFRRTQSAECLSARARLLLGCGAEILVNTVDRFGSTALHLLAAQINGNLRYLHLSSGMNRTSFNRLQYARAEQQDIYQSEILTCLQLLLNHNALAKQTNEDDLTAFQMILKSFYCFLTLDVDPNFNDPLQYEYVFNLNVLANALEMFLQAGCAPYVSLPCGQLPIKMLLQGILNISPIQYAHFAHDYLRCVSLLCEYGGCSNERISAREHCTCVSLLAALSESALNTVGVGSFMYDASAKDANAKFVDKLLKTLLRNKLCPNKQPQCGLEKISRRQRLGQLSNRGNALTEFVQLACVLFDPIDLRYVHMWLLTLLRHGADPDLEPYPADASFVHSQSSLRLQLNNNRALDLLLNHLIQHGSRMLRSPFALRILLLIWNSTSQRHVNSTLKNLAHKLFRPRDDSFDSDDPSDEAEATLTPRRSSFSAFVAELRNTPRSLKVSARLVVHRTVDWQLSQCVRQLPLPSSLHRFLMLESD